ncbi:MAG: hypothetical protein ACPL6C_03965, partial [bacterium]
VDTGGTIKEVVERLVKINKGNYKGMVICCITHGVLVDKKASANLMSERISDAIEKIYVTDTIPLSEHNREAFGDKLEIVSVAKLFADAIIRIHTNESVSSFF